MDDLQHLPLHVLREPKVKLRNVDTESVAFLEMQDSIREHGILQSLLVRPLGDVYEIVEGNYRYTCAKNLGLEMIPCIVRECSDDEALVLMLQANAISPETRLVDYAQQMKRIMQRNPDMTISELSCLIRKSPSFVSKCLLLNNLLREVQVAVNRGEICIDNAHMLAKIPRSMQKDYMDRAKIMPQKEFKPIAAACVKQFREAIKQGKMDAFYSNTFEPVAHLRPLKEIEEESKGRIRGALICTSEECQNALDGFYAGLRWVCHLDPLSVEEQEQHIRARQRQEVLDVYEMT